jgi:integrase
MAKTYTVTAQLSGGKSYAATFRNAMGERIRRGFGTTNKGEAGLICAGLVRLWNASVKSAAEVPGDVPLKAVSLYFGESAKDPLAAPARATGFDTLLPEVQAEVDKITTAIGNQPVRVLAIIREALTPPLLDRVRLRRENDTQRVELAATRQALDELTVKHRSLESSIIGRAAQAGAKARPLFEVLADFYRYIHTKTSRDSARDAVTVACSFVLALPEKTRTIADVTPAEIDAFITARCETANPKKKLARRHKVRELVGRFVNWACEQCGMPSHMELVEGPSQQQIDRERGDIHWHELKDVQAALNALKTPEGKPDTYWRALVATLGYAGVNLAELVWMRTTDLEWQPDGTAQFWITTVDDPEDSQAGHAIKTEHRRRHVRLHRKLLQPLLRSYVDAGLSGKVFLFPMPADMQRRERSVNGGSLDRWQVNTLSTVLRGHKGSKVRDAKGNPKRKPVGGKLPRGMNAKSLRRTFGSLLLRSGKSYAQVAAAMGNTEEIVRRHYAKLKGCEVSMDF